MRRLIVGYAAVAPILLLLLWPHALLAGIAILALSHALVLYATLRPNVQWLGPVITRFASDANEMWLTIDDGPTADTEAVLDMLAERGVRATFFVKGELAERDPELIRMMLARGHGVANHSHTHPSGSFWCLPPAAIADQIDGCNRVLEALTGIRPRWFRAPVGMKNPFVHPALAKRGMRLIGWTVRGFDSFESDADKVAARIVPRFAPGAVIVMHQGREHSLRCIARIVDEAAARGYTFVVPEDGRLRTT